MEEEDGFGFGIWGVTEVVDVTVWTKATGDGGTRWCSDGVTVGADGDFTVVADADAGLLAPDVGPPRTFGGGTDHGALFREGLLMGGVGSAA